VSILMTVVFPLPLGKEAEDFTLLDAEADIVDAVKSPKRRTRCSAEMQLLVRLRSCSHGFNFPLSVSHPGHSGKDAASRIIDANLSQNLVTRSSRVAHCGAEFSLLIDLFQDSLKNGIGKESTLTSAFCPS